VAWENQFHGISCRIEGTMNNVPIDADNRIQLPADWAEALGLRDQVTLEQTDSGILIRPCPRFTWDDVFSTKLTIGSAPPDSKEDELELGGDDFLF
jgi:antitoxin component of MazEF toxin-antitoxin module